MTKITIHKYLRHWHQPGYDGKSVSMMGNFKQVEFLLDFISAFDIRSAFPGKIYDTDIIKWIDNIVPEEER